jgi:hypothetical protein
MMTGRDSIKMVALRILIALPLLCSLMACGLQPAPNKLTRQQEAEGWKLLWDGKRITNDESANAFLSTAYRPGWELS